MCNVQFSCNFEIKWHCWKKRDYTASCSIFVRTGQLTQKQDNPVKNGMSGHPSITFASDKYFGLDDIGWSRPEGNTTVSGEGKPQAPSSPLPMKLLSATSGQMYLFLFPVLNVFQLPKDQIRNHVICTSAANLPLKNFMY
jgi:hypothetical protein